MSGNVPLWFINQNSLTLGQFIIIGKKNVSDTIAVEDKAILICLKCMINKLYLR